MIKFLVAVLFLGLAGCGGSKEPTVPEGCTKQDLNSKRIIISCRTLKSEKPTKCTGAGASTALCELGFDTNCQPARIEPSTIKAYVKETATQPESEHIILINKMNNKEMGFRQITDSNGTYLILKHLTDPGNTSTVDLPTCPEVSGLGN